MMARAVGTGVGAKERKPVSYRYEATTIQGRTVKGTIKAAGEIEAERMLIQQGYAPINVEVVPSMFSLEEALPSLFQIKPRDVIIFSRQLATLIRSGISLLPSLDVLQGQATTGRGFRRILESINNDLRSGGSFTQAIAKHPKAFSEVYVRTISVGEQSGNLEMVLNRMADYMERQGEIVGKIRKALTYPAMVLGVGVVVAAVLMMTVVPQMMNMFTTMRVELPATTRMLMAISNIFTEYPLYLLIAACLLVAAAVWMVKQPSGRRILDRVVLKAPLIGMPLLLGELARFSRTMSVLVSAGLNLQEIMELLPQASSNRTIRDSLSEVKERLMLGEGLSGPMSRNNIFPPLLVQMVAVGEQSNTLDFTMGVVADFYEVESDEKMSTLVGLIGPLSTIIIALFVGFIAISVLMPIYTLTGSF
jgi:type IV pilus assembly protein PilC